MNINELKVLLALNGGKRLPELEAEIFADGNAKYYYLSAISHEPTQGRVWAPRQAYLYAINVINGRWPEAEHIIATNPQYAYYYAASVIHGRWPEAEAVIRSDEYWQNRYYTHFNL